MPTCSLTALLVRVKRSKKDLYKAGIKGPSKRPLLISMNIWSNVTIYEPNENKYVASLTLLSL